MEHLFYEDCEEESHNNRECLLSELAYDEEALDYYENEKKFITRIDEWFEHVVDAWYFGARIFQHKPTGEYFWVYENLKGGDGAYRGSEDTSWIDLGNGTIQDWISAVTDKDAVIPALP